MAMARGWFGVVWGRVPARDMALRCLGVWVGGRVLAGYDIALIAFADWVEYLNRLLHCDDLVCGLGRVLARYDMCADCICKLVKEYLRAMKCAISNPQDWQKHVRAI